MLGDSEEVVFEVQVLAVGAFSPALHHEAVLGLIDLHQEQERNLKDELIRVLLAEHQKEINQ